MSNTRYHFFRKSPGQQPKWCSSRTDQSGLMWRWIEDLRKTYDVQRVIDANGKTTVNFLLLDRAKP